ncbi:MAG: UPF0182 family protein, partial [Desulfobacterales bacterium]|nr:UPF0182 family protein [Desulfobacterales bacterium]
FIGVTLFFFLVIFLNFWVASRYLGCTFSGVCRAEVSKTGKLIQAFRTGSLKVYTPLSIILAIPLAIPLYEQWEAALLYIFGSNSGVKDPVYGIDVSYYLFSLPIYNLLQSRLIITLLLLFVFLTILYYVERRMLASENQPLYKAAKIHLSVVIFLAFWVQAWGYMLERHMLLYNTNNKPLFFGPGYTEMTVLLPLIWLSAIFLLAMAISLIVFVNYRKGIYPLVIFTILFVLSHAGRTWDFLPDNIEKYLVKPNEIARQSKYIQNSVLSTLAAYNLTNVEKRDYGRTQNLRSLTDPQLRTDLENIPLWDKELLIDVFQEVQAIRPYYQFSDADVGRYFVNNALYQVYLAAREINLNKLPESAQNWINMHLKYTHGFGAVMIPAAQKGEERMKWYMRDMPPARGFSIKEPGIYYGTGYYTYAIAPNDSGELHYPGDQDEVLTNYSGTGGTPIGSLFKKALFAVYFKDRNIFFTTKTNSDSRILFRRNIQERIRTLTPFIKLDKDPYLVVTDDVMYWFQDAYTLSKWYPNGAPYNEEFNYIRNSIKIVVDAYNGTVTYYLVDTKDPIAKAYQRMYPGLIKPLEEMPENLRKQMRYPQDLFEIQMKMYSKYHQVNPETFYKDEDRWQFAEFVHRDSLIRMQPYYLTLDLIQHRKPEFVLVTPMLPINRENLRALALVGCDGDNYGRIIIYQFPRGQQVYGPSQINALIDQDTTIAELITLWDQHGSSVKRGKMIIFPLGKHILYIQPFYLEATGRLKIPELKRVIVCVEEIKVIDVTLEKAIDRLSKILMDREAGEILTPPGPLPDDALDQKDEVPSEPDRKTDPYPDPTESIEEIPDHVYYDRKGHEKL